MTDVHPTTLEDLGLNHPTWEQSIEIARKPAKRKPKVTHIIPDRRILETARKLAKGNMRLIEVRSNNCVVVHNNWNWRKK